MDYPAIHCLSEKGYADFWSARVYRDFRLVDHISRTALDGIEKESTYRDFHPLLRGLDCPIRVFVGADKASPIKSNIEAIDLRNYSSAKASIKFIEFGKSGHMIFDDEREKAGREIGKALREFDELRG